MNVIRQRGVTWSNSDLVVLSLAFSAIRGMKEEDLNNIFEEKGEDGLPLTDRTAKKNFFQIFSEIDYDEKLLQEGDLEFIQKLKNTYNRMNEEDKKEYEDEEKRNSEHEPDSMSWDEIVKMAKNQEKK